MLIYLFIVVLLKQIKLKVKMEKTSNLAECQVKTQEGFKRIGLFLYKKFTKKGKPYFNGDYSIGECGFEIPVKLTKKQLVEINEYIADVYGNDAYTIGFPYMATVYFQIAKNIDYGRTTPNPNKSVLIELA